MIPNSCKGANLCQATQSFSGDKQQGAAPNRSAMGGNMMVYSMGRGVESRIHDPWETLKEKEIWITTHHRERKGRSSRVLAWDGRHQAWEKQLAAW